MINVISKYKEMTKEEKKELAKKTLIYTGIGVVGFVLGKAICNKQLKDEVDWLNENLECVESDNFELEKIVDRQTLTLKRKLDDIEYFANEVEDLVYENEQLDNEIAIRDLSIMELVDGNTNRYRAIRSNVWSDEEILNNVERLDSDTKRAKNNYNAWIK